MQRIGLKGPTAWSFLGSWHVIHHFELSKGQFQCCGKHDMQTNNPQPNHVPAWRVLTVKSQIWDGSVVLKILRSRFCCFRSGWTWATFRFSGKTLFWSELLMIFVIMDCHVTAVSKAAFYSIRNIGRIRKHLTSDAAETMIHALVTSKLDSNN